MEIRYIVPDNFIFLNGSGLKIDEPLQGFESVHAIHHMAGKTHIEKTNGDGFFDDDYNILPILNAFNAKKAEIDAKKAEILAKKEAYLNSWDYIRDQRNKKLSESDWTQIPDSPLKNDPAWLEYRQSLRDVTENFATPQEVVWPEEPA